MKTVSYGIGALSLIIAGAAAAQGAIGPKIKVL